MAKREKPVKKEKEEKGVRRVELVQLAYKGQLEEEV